MNHREYELLAGFAKRLLNGDLLEWQGVSPSHLAFKGASKLMDRLGEDDILPDALMPAGDGGVVFVWFGPECNPNAAYIEVIIDNDGTMYGQMRVPKDVPAVLRPVDDVFIADLEEFLTCRLKGQFDN